MGRAQGVSPGIQMRRDCEARLRDLVPPDEAIIAVGTAEELRKLGSNIGSGGGWTFLVVTTDRVLFAPWGSPTEPHECIRFSRPETKAAKAIRASLEERSLPHELLHFKERSREERTGGNQVLATRR